MIRTLLFATTAIALPIAAAYAQSCPSQESMSALASATWNQVMGDNVAECGLNGSGPQQKGLTTGVKCVPITLAPGDITPTSGGSVDGWSLYVPPGEDGDGQWYGGLMYNGQQVSSGYFIALREVNGTVYAEEAKGSGWQIADPNNPGDTGNTWTYVGAPPSSGGCDSTQAASFDPPPAASVASDPPATQSATTDPGGSGQSCPGTTMPGAVTPGNGTFTIGSNTYSVSATNNDAASVNGSPINDGAYQTSQLVQGSDGQIYGQSSAPDNNGQWELLQGTGSDTWWQPITGAPPSITSATSVASTSSTNTTCSQPNQTGGNLADLMQVCAEPATTISAANAALCAQATQLQGLIGQTNGQIGAAQQDATTAAAKAANPPTQ